MMENNKKRMFRATGLWEYIYEKNGGFPVITAFLASLIMVQVLVWIGSMNFRFILPWLILIFFMYGFCEKKSIVRIVQEWHFDSKLGERVYAGVILAVVGNGLFLEGVLEVKNGIQFISVLIFLVLLYFNIWWIFRNNRKINIYSAAGGFLFATFSATGHLAVFETHGWWGYISIWICWFFLFYLCMECCFGIVEKSEIFEKPIKECDINKRRRMAWVCAAVCFLISVGVDVVFLLAFFPGVMEYDSFVQMCQVLGSPYSNHHPWLHTMLIKGIYQGGQSVLGSNNRAFALYSFFSICLLSFAFACVIAYLGSRGMHKRYLAILGAVYILSPINQMYSITMWKDIPFAVSVLLFILVICVIKDRVSEGKKTLYWWILIVPLGFCLCFFRSNGWYVFLGMIPFIIWTFWKQKAAAVSVVCAILIFAGIYKGPVFEYYQVEEPDIIESLSIPAQQIAAVIARGGDISEKQKLLISNIIDLEKVPEAYLNSTGCSDAIKDLVREKNNQQYIVDHTVEFFELWLRLFSQNKGIYVKAFVDETEGYWYHKIQFPFIWATYVHENGMGIYRASQLPETVVEIIRGYLKSYKRHFDKYLSTGLYVYIFLVGFLAAAKRRSRYLISWLPLIGIWGTLLIATPVWADLRYAYAIYVSVPFLLCLSCKKED